MRIRIGCLAAGVVGCASYPDVVEVEATQAGEAIGAVDPHVDEWVFEDDLPVDVGFVIAFDEPVTLPSAREGVWIEDPEGVELAVDVTARLDSIEIAPRAPLGGAQNHVLVLSTRIRDNSDSPMLDTYRIAFFTAE